MGKELWIVGWLNRHEDEYWPVYREWTEHEVRADIGARYNYEEDSIEIHGPFEMPDCGHEELLLVAHNLLDTASHYKQIGYVVEDRILAALRKAVEPLHRGEAGKALAQSAK